MEIKTRQQTLKPVNISEWNDEVKAFVRSLDIMERITFNDLFIQYHDRIGHTAFPDAVDDPSGHGADIGPPVSSDICFVTHASKRDTYILPSESFCNTLSYTRLACTGRSHKQKDGSGLPAGQLHYGDLLNNTALDLFQAEMVRFQHLLGF